MRGSSRRPSDDYDDDHEYDVDSSTGRYHALPAYWDGVLTSPREWGRCHVGDVLAVVGFAVLPFGVVATAVASQAAMALVFGTGCTLMAVGILLAPVQRMDRIDDQRRDPHRSDPWFRAPESVAGVVLSGLVLFGAGLVLLSVGL